MESDMVNRLINNKIDFKDAEDAFSFAKEKMNVFFPNFRLIDSDFSLSCYGYISRFGFFYLKYKYAFIEFKLECERGVLHHEIKINESYSKLHSFDSRMNDVLAFSSKNVIFTLSVLKQFLDSYTPAAPA